MVQKLSKPIIMVEKGKTTLSDNIVTERNSSLFMISNTVYKRVIC